jgi:Replication-relaxation
VSGGPRLAVPLAAAEILASLAEHRVLSTPQVGEIHFPGKSDRWVQMVLSRLAEAGLARFVPSSGAPRRVWYVTRRGAEAAIEAGLLREIPRLLDAEAASGPLQAHTLAVNASGICFMRCARERGDECGPLAWRHEVPHRLGQSHRGGTLFADAVLTYVRLTAAEVVVEQRFLELDRATLSVDRLAAELARYGRLFRAESREHERLWRARYPAFPPVICILAGSEDQAALRRRRDTTIAILQGDPDFARAPGLSVRLCLAGDLARLGPFAPIFVDARDPDCAVDWLVGDRPREVA